MSTKKNKYFEYACHLLFVGALTITSAIYLGVNTNDDSSSWDYYRARVQNGQIPKLPYKVVAKYDGWIGSGKLARFEHQLILHGPHGGEFSAIVSRDEYNATKEGAYLDGYNIGGSLYLADQYDFSAPAKKPSHMPIFVFAGIAAASLMLSVFFFRKHRACR